MSTVYLHILLNTYAYVRSLQLLTSGDIHPNPGPTSRSDSLSLSTDSYMDLINSGISVMHLNIQSLKPKLDILAIEAQLYDILIFTRNLVITINYRR